MYKILLNFNDGIEIFVALWHDIKVIKIIVFIKISLENNVQI